MDLVGATAIEGQQLVAKRRIEPGVRVGQDSQRPGRSRVAAECPEFGQDAVDAVERGARHQADEGGAHRTAAYSPGIWAWARVRAMPSWARALAESCVRRVSASGERTVPCEFCATSKGFCCSPSTL